MKISRIYQQLEKRSKSAILSLWANADNPMRDAFGDLLDKESVIGEPVIESAFPWKSYGNDDWKRLFDRQTLEKLRQVRKFEPFTHQVESWNYLNQGESIVVTSGTGSGKTECFLYPVMNDIATSNNNGIQAIFLYPLNALMEDQKERLGHYCDCLNINFAVYNRNTPEHEAGIERISPFTTELQCRDHIRENHPKVLLTNPSMLEYILVRPKDQALINASHGQLKWIVIDEAHSYSGSAAVELQYLLKRVLDAFDITDITNVNFVCTSATITGSEGSDRLRHFISKLTGQQEDRIHVITGERVVPEINFQEINDTLGNHPLFQNNDILNNVFGLRTILNTEGAIPLKKAWKILNGNNYDKYDEVNVLELLDTLCETNVNGLPILNLRLHLFYKIINGIYSCLNPDCLGSVPSCMGSLTSNQTSQCVNCGSPILELMQCKYCGTVYVRGQVNSTTNEIRQIPNDRNNFSLLGFDDENANDNILTNDGDWSEFELCKLTENTAVQPKNGVTLQYYHFDIENGKLKLLSGVGARNELTWVECRQRQEILCASCGNNSTNFKHFRINATMINSIISPIFLDETKPENADWGKFIAFTDSRQQTAISAKTFNIDEERAFMRSKLVKEMYRRQEEFKSDPNYNAYTFIVSYLENKIDRDEAEESQYQQAKAYLANSNRPISLHEVAEIIFCKEMLAHMDEDYISNPNIDYETPYKAAMLRNFIGRRTINDPNIENLGFVTVKYPALENIMAPDCLRQLLPKATDNDWRDFLKICIDFEIRAHNHFQPLIRLEKNFVRDTNFSRPIFESGHQVPQGADYNVATWPTVSMNGENVSQIQNHLVVLICAACNLYSIQDLQTHVNEINNILNQAWVDLTNNILTQVRNGEGYDDAEFYPDHRYRGAYYIDLSMNSTAATLVLTEKAKLCPVTKRFVDTTFMGISPTIKGFISLNTVNRYNTNDQSTYTIPKTSTADLADIGNWINTNENALILKRAGIWSDNYDRLFYGMTKTAYIGAEHSAQQDRILLDQYKEEFVNNDINVLFCSTTMEMGVDIGDVEIAVMETVPPTSANYLQRAGRAGRSGQSRALAFTICNSSPIGVRVFNDTMWPFVSTNEMKDVIESEQILQRHFNAFFFRNFICIYNGGLKIGTNLNSFFEDGTVYNDILGYLNRWVTSSQEKTHFDSVFVNQNYHQALTKTINKIEEIHNHYMSDVNEMISEYDYYIIQPGQNEQRRARAIKLQLYNYRTQILLTYLSENQFFPDANMPTSIIDFVHFNAANYKRYINLIDDFNRYLMAYANAQTKVDKDDASENIEQTNKKIERLKKKVTSSRETNIGLNEYAPEQTVVINEENFVSSGILTANEFGTLSQRRYLQECDMCHRIYYQPITGASNQQCSCSPQSHLRSVLPAYRNIHPFAYAYEVIGFESDINANRHEKTVKSYYNIASLLTNLDWSNPIDSVNLMEISTNDNDGEIIFSNAGDGYGFAICRKCGRAYVEGQGDEVLNKFTFNRNRKHYTLHGTECEFTNPNTDLDRHVVLTGRLQTDYCAFKFYDDVNQNEFTEDKTLIYSLGVLLRKALVEELGIDENEIDYGIAKSGDSKVLFIYDTNKGGSGYSKAFTDVVKCQRIFARALNYLKNATCNCETSDGGACSFCLIDHKSVHFINNLSKARVLQWLVAQQHMNVAIPDEVINYSTNALVSYKNAKRIAENSALNHNVSEISFFTSDEGLFAPNEWVNRDSFMGQLIEKLLLKGKTVNIYFEYHRLAHTSFDDLYLLTKLKDQFVNVNFHPISDMGRFKTILIVKTATGIQRYFTDEVDTLSLSNEWGNNNYLYVDDLEITYTEETLPTVQELMQSVASRGNIIREGIMENTSFPLGDIFDVICRTVDIQDIDLKKIDAILSKEVITIEYSDNFLKSGIGCQILYVLIDTLKQRYDFEIQKISLYLDSKDCYNDRYGLYSYINFTFKDPDVRNKYIIDTFQLMYNLTPEISNVRSDHFRWLRLRNSLGDYVEIRPDGGIGRGWIMYGVKYSDIYNDPNVYDPNIYIETTENDILYYIKISERQNNNVHED